MKLKVQCLHGDCGSRCGGHKRGSQCAIAGEISGGAIKLARSQGCDDAIREVSRGHNRSPLDRGPNIKTGTETLFSMKTESQKIRWRHLKRVCEAGAGSPKPRRSAVQTFRERGSQPDSTGQTCTDKTNMRMEPPPVESAETAVHVRFRLTVLEGLPRGIAFK